MDPRLEYIDDCLADAMARMRRLSALIERQRKSGSQLMDATEELVFRVEVFISLLQERRRAITG